MATSRLLSPLGMARAALDLVLPRRDLGEDANIDELIGGRFGSEVVTRLVEPLVGSIHAARTADLSAAATVPQILAAARRSRSLLLAMRAEGGASTGRTGVPLTEGWAVGARRDPRRAAARPRRGL